MRACSFRTRSSSSFCRDNDPGVRGHLMGQRTRGQGSRAWAQGGLGWLRLLTFHPRRSARARQPWSQSPSQATSLWGSENQISQACPSPLPALPWLCVFMPSPHLGPVPRRLHPPQQIQALPVGLLGVKVHASPEAHHQSQEGVSLQGRASRGEIRALGCTPAL